MDKAPAKDFVEEIEAKFKSTFGQEPTVIAVSPGRVEFIGNHTDYNNGPCIGACIDRCVYVAASKNSTGKNIFTSEF